MTKRNVHSVTLDRTEVTKIRDAIEEAEQSGDLPDGFYRGTGGSQEDPVEDWLTGKFGEALFATFLRDEFLLNATYQINFENFVKDEEADSVINGERIDVLDVKTVGVGKKVCPILEGVYQSHPTDSSFLYVIVCLDDGQDLREDPEISGEIRGVQTAENVTHFVKEGEPVTSYDGKYDYYEAGEDQRILYPYQKNEILHLPLQVWEDDVLDVLDFPPFSLTALADLG